METVTNIASAASRAIWGDGTNPDEKKDVNESLGKEPVAGELGDVKKGEPYDKGNVGKDTTTTTTLPSKSTLTSNPKPATTESSSTDPSQAAVLLPESESQSRDTPPNLLATADQAKLPSQNTSSTESKPLTFSKSDPTDSSNTVEKKESLEEKASAVKGTTGFDEKSAENNTTTNTGTTTTTTAATSGSTTTAPPLTDAPAGLREEKVGSSGLLEEKRVKPESASEPKVGESSTTPKKSTSSEGKKSLDGGSGSPGEKKSLKEKIKEKLHRHKD